ncbi:flagellar biosynthetic protein FliR [Simkania negevensis]|uniref:Flagellar biosynthetic protein FliR n=1 Tax=Simkania negevensis TaxID=83561 RepID=A0ABS3AR24_9BACT|nr:flagellar biosynthetic protein FliR [Simkania negevensis]
MARRSHLAVRYNHFLQLLPMASMISSNILPEIIAKMPLIPFLSIFLLTFARIAPIAALAPFLAAKIMPAPVKVGLSVLLAGIFLPYVIALSTTQLQFDARFVLLALKEIFVGFIIGFLATIPFNVAASSGVIIDFQRGASSLMVQDPALQNQVSPLGILYNYTAIVLFFELGGLFIFFQLITLSYTALPPDKFINSQFFMHTNPFWVLSIDILNYIQTLAVQLAGPSLLVVLMTETFLGLCNRLAPQVQITFLGMSLKSVAGIAILVIAWSFILKEMGRDSISWFQNTIHDIIPLFGL